MHELPVTKSIFQVVLKHAQKGGVKKVVTVNLEIGALSDLQGEWVQRYFDHLSLGSVVEGAVDNEDLSALSMSDLRKLAAGLGIPGRSKMKREELEEAILSYG